jgi:hypothetical protein
MLKKKIKAAVMEPVKYIDARPGIRSVHKLLMKDVACFF